MLTRWLMLTLTVACLMGASEIVQGFSDDFESYSPGTLGDPWADWNSGNPPSSGNTVVNDPGNGNGGSDQYITLAGEPVRWFENSLTNKDLVVEITFYVRVANTAAVFDFFAGSMGSPGMAQPMNQYSVNVGHLTINPGAGTVSYGGGIAANFVADDSTWNEIKIRLISRTSSGLMGQGTLLVNGVGTGATNEWTLGAKGLNGVDFYGNDWGGAYAIDDFSVVQAGTAPLLEEMPDDYVTLLPGDNGPQGGITTDGIDYVYVTGGSGTGGSLYRYRISANSWTTLTGRPDGGTNPHEGHGISIDSNGKIVVMAGYSFDTGCNADVYDIESGTWTGPFLARSPDTYELMHGTESAGDLTFALSVNSQAGFTTFESTSNTFVTGQVGGPTPPGGNNISGDMAYVPDSGYLYKIGHNNGVNGGLARLEIAKIYNSEDWATAWTVMANLPMPVGVALDQQNALTYVPEDCGALFALLESWGVTAIYRIPVPGGGLIAAVHGSRHLCRYDIATDTWTTLPNALPYVFGSGDDITAARMVPVTGSFLLVR